MASAWRILALVSLLLFTAGCDNSDSAFLSETLNDRSPRMLFVVSGACYGGGVTTSTGSNTIVAFDIETGAYHHTVYDYGLLSPSDSPVSIEEFDEDNLMVLVENTSGRRIDIVRKDGGSAITYLVNTTALSAVMRSLKRLSDGSLLVSKSSAIEKFGSNKARVTQGANPWVNAPAAPCATATTLISSVNTFDNGKILFTHAAATPNNKFGLISATGYSVAGDCLAATAGPATTALPTAAVIHPSGKTLIAFGSTTAASNYIYSYDINPTTNSIGGAAVAFNDVSVINGPSTMTLDPETGNVYVANGINTFNTIEEFTFSSGILSRTRTTPFAGPNIYTRCVSSMKVLGYSP